MGDAVTWFWPVRTGQTFIDVWTIFHLAFWVFMGSTLWAVKMPLPNALLGGVAAAYCWELFERYAEQRWPTIWLNPESWLNSYVSDPLTCVVGVAFAFYALENWR